MQIIELQQVRKELKYIRRCDTSISQNNISSEERRL
ncbi:hypothetical protein NIES3974_47730 [Calothrix sp. NIES-3974]|nr:hypothetical protein NIES3974_47730 [Calothrix sp. NIES-3974]